MDRIFISKCPICGSEKINSFITASDNLVTSELFTIDKCEDCGFKFTQNRPNSNELPSYYKSESYAPHNKSKSLFFIFYSKIRNFMNKKKFNFITETTKLTKGKILDIGTGTADLLSIFKKQNWAVNGIDVSKDAIDEAKKRYDINVLPPSELENFENNTFDVITMFHSLEHIENLEQILNTIKRILKKDGYLFIALPNAESFDADYYKQYWAAYDLPRHLWHFSIETITALLKKIDYKCIAKKKLPFDVFYIALLSEKYKRSKFVLLKSFFIAIYFFIKSSKKIYKSSSLIYVFKNN